MKTPTKQEVIDAIVTSVSIRGIELHHYEKSLGDCYGTLCELFGAEIQEEQEPEKTLPFTSYSLQFVLGWEKFCDLTGISYYAKREGFEVKDSEIFNIPESKAKEFNLI